MLCVGVVAILSIVTIVGVVSCCIVSGRADERMDKMNNDRMKGDK